MIKLCAFFQNLLTQKRRQHILTPLKFKLPQQGITYPSAKKRSYASIKFLRQIHNIQLSLTIEQSVFHFKSEASAAAVRRTSAASAAATARIRTWRRIRPYGNSFVQEFIVAVCNINNAVCIKVVSSFLSVILITQIHD